MQYEQFIHPLREAGYVQEEQQADALTKAVLAAR